MVTELRVHGVGGSSAEAVLDTGPVRRVAGDGQSGFFITPGHPEREAYSWGNLTSGNKTRALWLLMLPFTLVNAAFWMAPRAGARVSDALVRLLALSLTATAVLSAVGVGTDLLGWQCAARSGCRDRHSFLRFLGEGAMATPGRRALVGSIVPLMMLAVLWYLSRRSGRRYEEVEPPAKGGGSSGLADPTFWYGAGQVARLRALHLSVGLAVIGMALVFPAWDWDHRQASGLRFGDALLYGAQFGVVLTASIGVCLPRVVQREAPRAAAPRWPARLSLLAAGLLLVSMLWLAVPAREGWVDHAARALPGYGMAVSCVFLAQLAGVLALVVAARGWTQAVFAGLGLLLAALLSAGLAFRVGDWLDGGQAPTDGGTLELPIAYGWAGVGFVAVVIPGAVVIAVRAWNTLRTARRAERASVLAQYGDSPLNDRVDAIARTRAIAGMTDPALRWIHGFTAAALVSAVVSMGLCIALGRPPVRAVEPGLLADVLRLGTLAGTWAVSLLAAGLVALGFQAYRTQGLRRTVGIVWDLGTFWPRAAHPLAAPCYAERAVPDLVVRVRHLARTGEGVVLSGHSQGSVLAAAVVWQLPTDVLAKVRLVTHGSPLARLYGRVFPAWFGTSCLQELEARVGPGGWTNLWRATDPIGGRVHTVADRELLDPPRLAPAAGDPAPPAPAGHSHYDGTDEYAEVVATASADLQSRMDA